MPADGVMGGGRRGEEKLEIRTTRPNAYGLLLRRWFHFPSCLLQHTHLMLDFVADEVTKNHECERGTWIVRLHVNLKGSLTSLHDENTSSNSNVISLDQIRSPLRTICSASSSNCASGNRRVFSGAKCGCSTCCSNFISGTQSPSCHLK